MINSITTEQLIIEFMEAGGEDLERLPPRFKLLIERLLEERKEFLERIKSLEEQVGKSEEKAKQNSKNSSQPPSQDPLDTPKEPQKSKTMPLKPKGISSTPASYLPTSPLTPTTTPT